MIKISPSTNPENEENLVTYVKELEQTSAEFLHCDVMDGKFVEAKCLNAEKLFEVSQNSTIALDVHLMVDQPLLVLDSYLLSKPTILTVHFESFQNKNVLLEVLTRIKKHKIMAGISIKPNTTVQQIEQYLPFVDLVLVMSVEPGLSGQKYIASTEIKVKYLKQVITNNNYNIKIEVDGGINDKNIVDLYNAGADIAVLGSAIYNAKNRAQYIDNLISSTKKPRK